MPPVPPRWLSRAVVATLVVAALFLAWREGGGADARVPPPKPEPPRAEPSTPGHGAAAFEVTTRLLDALGDAVIDAPSLASAQPFIAPYWRKMRAPWTHLSGQAASMALTLAFRTSQEPEKQLAVAVSGAASWVPQARIWNMNEGSFDERECILAPTPAAIAVRLAIPPHARLRLSPAVVSPLPLTTIFDVMLVDAAGAEHALSTTRIAGLDARTWVDLDLDLAPWGGQRVELRLKTSTDRPAQDEKKWAPPVLSDAGADGGAADALAIPPMSVALWGDPVVVAEQPTRAPYNVLWFVVDALRPDVIASLHEPAEDAAKLAAARPPLDALLPGVPGLTPNIDALVARSVRFPHAWSAGTWTRAGTLAMLAGERSTELGVDSTAWILPAAALAAYYASAPPLAPLVLRRSGVVSAAFVNNFFMAGYVPVGVDMGFQRVTDHRYRTRDTSEITRDALGWMQVHARDRFFLFVNYNSPHEPYDPPKEMLGRVPPPPLGPRDRQVRAYMAEAGKDDAAIGQLLGALETLGLTASTLVVVTADHGETLSTAHDAMGMDNIRQRFHHAVGNFEETTRIPLVMALPGVLDGGRAVLDRVRSTDIAPTILELEGLDADPRMSGRSLLGLARGVHEAEPRVVVTEGRQSRGILWDHWRLVTHDGSSEDDLFDLDDDPGERHGVARAHPDVVAEMRARLAAALANVRTADAKDPAGPAVLPVLHLRFAGGGRARRVSGHLDVGDGKHGATISVDPVGVLPDAVRIDGPVVTLALTTTPDALVGLDLRVDPPGAPVTWTLFLDDAPWPEHATFAGPFGLPAVAARAGVTGDEARAEIYAPALPIVDPSRELGLFVTRDRPGDAPAAAPADSGEGAREMQRVLQQWGYAHGSH